MRYLLSFVVFVLLAGCASTPQAVDENYRVQLEFYERAQVRAEKKAEKACFEMRAAPGQTLKIEGLESITANCGDHGAVTMRPPAVPKKKNMVAEVLKAVVPFAQMGAGIYTNRINAEQNTLLWTSVIDSVAGMERADNSVNYGSAVIGDGNGDGARFGDGAIVGDSNGDGDRFGDGALVGDGNGDGDRFGDGALVGDGNGDGDRFGDNALVGDQNNNSGRFNSNGPFDDHSDNSDNSDNSGDGSGDGGGDITPVCDGFGPVSEECRGG